MFGRKSRAEKLREQAESNSLVPMAALAAAYAGARPVIERLLYDDDLRDNIRTFIESARSIVDELSGEDPQDIITKLWNDDKLRGQVEAAAGAASQGSKRIRGEKVRDARRMGRPAAVPRPRRGRRLPVPAPEDRTPGAQVRRGHLRFSDLRRIGAGKQRTLREECRGYWPGTPSVG